MSDAEAFEGASVEPSPQRFDLFAYVGDITEAGYEQVIRKVLEAKALGDEPNQHVVFGLVTYGGSADAAYKIARHLQKRYETVIMFAPYQCYSAGTLLSIGGHQLLTSPFTELGPLDVQVPKRDEISGERRSGLMTQATFRALGEAAFEHFEHSLLSIVTRSSGMITFGLAAELSAKMTTGLLGNVYSHIDPDGVGSDKRDTDIAVAYAMRLAMHSGNIGNEAIYHLVHSYPAHGFVIDDWEVKTFFHNVVEASEDLMGVFRRITEGWSPETGEPKLALAKVTSEDGSKETPDDQDQQDTDSKGGREGEDGRTDGEHVGRRGARSGRSDRGGASAKGGDSE